MLPYIDEPGLGHFRFTPINGCHKTVKQNIVKIVFVQGDFFALTARNAILTNAYIKKDVRYTISKPVNKCFAVSRRTKDTVKQLTTALHLLGLIPKEKLEAIERKDKFDRTETRRLRAIDETTSCFSALDIPTEEVNELLKKHDVPTDREIRWDVFDEQENERLTEEAKH